VEWAATIAHCNRKVICFHRHATDEQMSSCTSSSSGHLSDAKSVALTLGLSQSERMSTRRTELGLTVDAQVAEIGPAEATQFISAFKSAGKVDSRLVKAYADDISAGRWMLNGASVVFSKELKVLDGRARLLACIQANKAFRTLVIRGIDENAFETIDSVRKRRLADVLTIRRFPHGRALAAALRIIWAYQNGSIASPRSLSPIVLLDLIQAHPEIRDSVVPSLRAAPVLPHGSGIALHYLFSLAEPRKSEKFFAQIGTAPLPSEDAPAVRLHRVLDELRTMGGYRKQLYVLAVSIKAWNAFLTGRPLKQLRYSPGREPFPEIAGLKGSESPHNALSNSESAKSSSGQSETLVARVETVTPERAQQLLASNTLNRGISGSVVDKYARDMRAGRWCLNGQTIKLTKSGRLLDGQHRLEAVKKAKRPFPAIVVEGVPESCLGSLDVGHKRGLSEILRDRAETNTASLASALRWLWMLKHEVVLAANTSPTNGEMLELLEANPGIRDGQKYAASLREFMGSGITAALHYIFGEKDRDQADLFFERLIDGVELASTSPILHLRQRLIKIRASHRVRAAEAERVALTIKAWNAYRTNRPLQQLSWRTRGASREELPAAV
jgi:hypothetical protein